MSALQYQLPNCFAIPTKLSIHVPGDRLWILWFSFGLSKKSYQKVFAKVLDFWLRWTLA